MRFKMVVEFSAKEILRGDFALHLNPYTQPAQFFCSFGQCLLSGADSGYVSQTESPTPLDALATVSRLVRIFPFLRDEVKLGDKCVGLYSKAQQIVIYFHDVLGPRVPACNFTNMNALTGCCDSYTLAVLRHLKIVSLSEELSSQIDARQDFRAGSETEVPDHPCPCVVLISLLIQRISDHFTIVSPGRNPSSLRCASRYRR